MVDHSRIWKMLFDRPVLKLIILIFVIAILFRLDQMFTKSFESVKILSLLYFILTIALTVYSVILIIRIILEHLVRRSLNRLFNAQNLASLLISYAIFIFGILILVSIGFAEIQHLELGYLTYGKCSETFNKTMIQTDPNISHDYMYFSSVTFFTIGYGDICPMGAAKFLSVITAFIGNIVTVVLMGIVITLYLKRRESINSSARKRN
jgi:Ion channel